MNLEIILHAGLATGTVLLFATIGEIFAERSGILNLGVEGMMIIGAIVLFKMSSPIRARLAPLVATFEKMSTNVGGQVAAEIEMLVLNAVKK